MTTPKAEHPRPDYMREDWHNLNGCWAFDFLADEKPPAKLSRNIVVPFSWTSPLSGIEQDVKGVAWYRRGSTWQPRRSGDHVWLCFMAVDYQCDVYVNGQWVGGHKGGYDPFSFDVNLHWGKGENRIEVRVQDDDKDSQPRGKQSYGETRGLWQTVYLEARPDVHIRSFKLTTRIDGEISVKLSSSGAGEPLLDFGAGAQGGMSMRIDNPRLWSPQDPYLYEGTVTLGEDVIHTYFGIREVGAATFGGRENRWITLNGKPVYLNGTLDQSYNPQGHFTLPDEQSIIDEVRRLKELGLNLVRIHIKPEEPRKLYWLDKMGIMVMADMACFWGEALPAVREQYEKELSRFIARDINHPSIIAWVVFNETWGLFTDNDGGKVFTKDTQAWVKRMYEQVKAFDGTRLVEDNSPCNFDHVQSDINSWHFYINGYRQIKDHIADAVKHTHPGSPWNYIGGNEQNGAPLMNSECGMVWGVDGSAGESDLAWQYHYMLNEYRLHDALCGFVFTEFHDVINEFNGYYRIDNRPKDFGYQGLCDGMTIADLHAADFVAYDAPPCATVGGGQNVSVPLVHSNFDEATHGKELNLRWKLVADGITGRRELATGAQCFLCEGYGAHGLGALNVAMPHDDAVAILSWELLCQGKVLSRNFVTFDVRGAQPAVSVQPKAYTKAEWGHSWQALGGHKQNGAGAGCFAYAMDATALLKADVQAMEIVFEASAKRVLKKDVQGDSQFVEPTNLFTQAYTVDPGENPNSYFMSDDSRFPSRIEVWINGTKAHAEVLDNDPADARGVLSWHHQVRERALDEAGSYGYRVRVALPEEVRRSLDLSAPMLSLEIRAEHGLALYGRNAGRYPMDIVLIGT